MTRSPREAKLDRLRIAVCAVLLVLVAGQYLLTIIEIPIFYQRVRDRQVPTLLYGGDADVSNELMAERAADRGLTLGAFALYYLVSGFVSALGFWVAAGLVLWKHGGDWYRWLTALALFFFPSGNLYFITNVAHPGISPYLNSLSLIWPVFFLFLYLFPDGRGVPRWSRWPVAGLVTAHFGFQVLGFLAGFPNLGVQPPTEALQLFTVIIGLGLLFILGCQIYRYIRVSGPVERRQIQWFVAAIALILLISTVLEEFGGEPTETGDIPGYAGDLSNLALVLVPIAITISILRYRLWDIDVIIRRTLIYSVLTALLALAYFGSVLVLQTVFSAVTGESGNALVVVISTLGIAALFVPLRGRVQRAIDRRFYRKKYDAARTLAHFGARARDVVELEQLQGQLVDVVEEAIQPAHVSLWVRKER